MISCQTASFLISKYVKISPWFFQKYFWYWFSKHVIYQQISTMEHVTHSNDHHNNINKWRGRALSLCPLELGLKNLLVKDQIWLAFGKQIKMLQCAQCSYNKNNEQLDKRQTVLSVYVTACRNEEYTSPPCMFFMLKPSLPFFPFLFFFFLQQHFLIIQKQQVTMSSAATTAIAIRAHGGTVRTRTQGWINILPNENYLWHKQKVIHWVTHKGFYQFHLKIWSWSPQTYHSCWSLCNWSLGSLLQRWWWHLKLEQLSRWWHWRARWPVRPATFWKSWTS